MNDTPENEWVEELDMLSQYGGEWHRNPEGKPEFVLSREIIIDFIENLRIEAYHRGQEDMKRKAIESLPASRFTRDYESTIRNLQVAEIHASLQALKTDSSDNTK